MSQLRCQKCNKLWREPVTKGPCGLRVSSTVWCDGELVEHECGGPSEACCLRGCEECGGESLTTMAELRIEIAQLRARVPDVDRLTRERDEARARVAGVVEELSAFLSEAENCAAGRSGMQVPYSGALANHTRHPSTVRDVRRMLRSLNGDSDRIAVLSAPPVVPEGWEVASRLGRWGLLDRHGYAVDADELGVMHMSIDDYIPWAALRALAWANENDARPPHAGDE